MSRGSRGEQHLTGGTAVQRGCRTRTVQSASPGAETEPSSCSASRDNRGQERQVDVCARTRRCACVRLCAPVCVRVRVRVCSLRLDPLPARELLTTVALISKAPRVHLTAAHPQGAWRALSPVLAPSLPPRAGFPQQGPSCHPLAAESPVLKSRSVSSVQRTTALRFFRTQSLSCTLVFQSTFHVFLSGGHD